MTSVPFHDRGTLEKLWSVQTTRSSQESNNRRQLCGPRLLMHLLPEARKRAAALAPGVALTYWGFYQF